MEDVYKARCADLERQIVQLKLELAEAKVCFRASSIFSDACYFVLPVHAVITCITCILIAGCDPKTNLPSFLAPFLLYYP